jgi:hypothetical protein
MAHLLVNTLEARRSPPVLIASARPQCLARFSTPASPREASLASSDTARTDATTSLASVADCEGMFSTAAPTMAWGLLATRGLMTGRPRVPALPRYTTFVMRQFSEGQASTTTGVGHVPLLLHRTAWAIWDDPVSTAYSRAATPSRTKEASIPVSFRARPRGQRGAFKGWP